MQFAGRPIALLALVALFPLAFAAVARLPSLDLRTVTRQEGAPAVPPEFNINSGGGKIGRFVGDADEWLVGAQTTIFEPSSVVIGGAEPKNEPMYKSHRYAPDGLAWGYDIPVMEPGVYGCTVHFAETSSDAFMPGQRVFDLYLASSYGEPTLFKDIDIFAELNGAEFTVLTKTAIDLIVPGVLAVRVNPSAGNAIISGITCERTADLPADVEPDYETDPNLPVEALGDTDNALEAEMEGAVIVGTEINVNAGGPEVGRFLAEDSFWIRGNTSFFGGPEGVEIGGAEDKNKPALSSHRYGVNSTPFGYIIPIEMSGMYDCSLHFAETDSDSFAVGARVFDVMVQDQVKSDLDVYRDTGMAPFTSYVKTFTDLSVGDKLYVALVPTTGNAFLSAITCERVGELPDGDLGFMTVASPEVSPDLVPTESPEEMDSTTESFVIEDPIAVEPLPSSR